MKLLQINLQGYLNVKRKNSNFFNKDILTDQEWRSEEKKARYYEMTYAGATSFLRRPYSRDLKNVDITLEDVDLVLKKNLLSALSNNTPLSS